MMTSKNQNYPEHTEFFTNDMAFTRDEGERPESLAQSHGAEPPSQHPQLDARVLRLLSSAEELQQHVAVILDEVQQSNAHLGVLTRHVTNPDAARPLEEHLAELVARQEVNDEKLTELAQAIAKLSRTQFRSNALSDVKEKQTGEAIATLQDMVSRREEVQTELAWREQQHLAKVRADARGELAVELLPSLDGLEAAIESASTLLARERERATRRIPPPDTAPTPPSRRTRLRIAFANEPLPVQTQTIPETSSELVAALAAWLEGLELVRERFLSLLIAENIQTIFAQGQAFDPRLHIAVGIATDKDASPGTIVEVVRKGYRQQDRVLRFAEVIVVKAEESHDHQQLSTSNPYRSEPPAHDR